MNFHSIKKQFLFLLFIFLLTVSLPAVENRLSSGNFMKASLKASGASEEKCETYFSYMEEMKKDFLIQSEDYADEKEKAEFALIYSFDRLLKKFKTDQSDVGYTIDSGFYNCVSSCVIYVYFLKALNISFEIFETADHVFVEVFAGGNRIRVETTNPYGFNPGEKKQSPDSDKYFVASPKNYVGQKLVDDRRLVGMIYNNRVSVLFKNKNYEQAYVLSEEAAKVQGYSDEAFVLLNKAGSNLCGAYARKGQGAEALKFARKHLMTYGMLTGWDNNLNAAFSDVLNDCFDKKDFPKALELLDSEGDVVPEAGLQTMRTVTIKNYISWLSVEKEYDFAFSELEKYKNELKSSDYKTLSKRINDNEAVRIHNACVPFLNNGDYETAAEILKAGIEKLSDPTLLKNDLKKITR